MSHPMPGEPVLLLSPSPDGEMLASTECLALLMGWEVEQVKRWLPDGARTAELPPEALRAGRRRAREAMAATSSTSPLAALRYWCEREGRGRLVFHGAEVWLSPAEAAADA